MAIGTARMAHLALPNSELHEGFSFAGLEALVRDPTAAVLFPGPDSPPTPPTRTLIVVDGTWPQARKIIRRNPLLARLRRFTLTPARPGAYRIRREPTPDCLATIEAVVEVLAILEGDRERCAGLLEAFTFMVERQLDYARNRPEPRRRAAHVAPPPLGPELAALARTLDAAVLIHGEANAHAVHERAGGVPELLHVVASRPARGERFEALLAPRRPLGARTAFHLGLDARRLYAGETVAAALARLADFLRSGDRLCGWGPFAADLLEREGLAPRPRLDLRAIVARRLPSHPRGIDRVAALLDIPALDPWAAGRAGRTIGSIEGIFAALLARAAGSP